jgi:Cu/Ag efflux pump CusA
MLKTSLMAAFMVVLAIGPAYAAQDLCNDAHMKQMDGMIAKMTDAAKKKNYQNFGDPFVVILALPATLCGILVMLFITGTTLSVPSLMGAIMAVGVASANSILLVTFAHEQQLAGKTSFEAAVDAGHTRIRPVLMTAAAMIVGMLPMAIGGAGEEQNAALARAVIGGLLFATPTTLLVVPYLFAMLRKGNDGKRPYGVFEEAIE